MNTLISRIKSSIINIHEHYLMKKMGVWYYFVMKEEQGAKIKIGIKYVGAPLANIDKLPRRIIYMCNDFIGGNGLADRFKSIISVFCWCKDNNVEFKINFVSPFRLDSYLDCKDYNWKVDDSEISYNLEQVDIRKLFLVRYIHTPDVDANLQKLQEEWLDSHMLSGKPQVHVYSNLNSGNHRFSELFNQLFKPNKRLQEILNENKKMLTDDYVSISFRFTTLLGDFQDCFDLVLQGEAKEKLIRKSLDVVEQLAEKIAPNQKILVTADSSTFIDRVISLPRVYVVKGPIGHIDYKSSDEINIKTFVDFLLISEAKKIYLGLSENMYKSEFSKTASLIHNVPFEIIEY